MASGGLGNPARWRVEPGFVTTMGTNRPRNRLIAFFLTKRFARFLVFGGVAALVNLAVGEFLYSSPRVMALMPYSVAVAVGAASGMVVNFALNYVYNFRYLGRSPISQFRTFVVVATIGVGLTALVADVVLWLAALSGAGSHLKVGPVEISMAFAAHVFAVGLVTFYSFAAHSAFSFNEGLRAGVRRLKWSRQSEK